MLTPKGYYTSSDYIGYFPDGTTMRFPTEEEYFECFEEIVNEGDDNL